MTRAVFTIPAGRPFLADLARGLLAAHPTTDDPFALADVRLYLPTRRAARALQEVFLKLLGCAGRALLLPRLLPLGEADEEAHLLAGGEAAAPLAPAIAPLRRRALLSAAIRRMGAAIGEPPGMLASLRLADSLARLLDEAVIEGADLTQLAAAVPADLAAHFATSAQFIRLLTEVWPDILQAEGVMEAAERRRRLLEAEARLIAAAEGPVYVAGSTGSQPATALLMRKVAERGRGGVVLPGLDLEMDERAWQAIGASHPQAALRAWLVAAGLERRDVGLWHASPAGASPRLALLSEVLRPAPTTDEWPMRLAALPLEDGLEGLTIAEAEDEAEEARIIAAHMRKELETPTRTAALVTPDRVLARRVSAELRRWDIEVDDSAGYPLSAAPVFTFLDTVLAIAEDAFAPVPLAALLKHKFLALPEAVDGRAAEDLERLALRSPLFGAGTDGLKRTLVRAADRGAGTAEAAARAGALLDGLKQALRPLTEGEARAPVVDWAHRMLRVAAALAPTALWHGKAGEAASALLGDVISSGDLGEPVDLALFRRVLFDLARDTPVRGEERTHPRLAIWGPLEARLQSADLVILGGLVEGGWPSAAAADAWASRAMREAAGLSDPERRIGQQAHDFALLAASPAVLLTSPKKAGGKRQVASRFFLRLKTLMRPIAGAEEASALAPDFREAVKALGAPLTAHRPAARPAPCPALSLRPRSISITEVETLRRDPFAVYARHVLRLTVLEEVGALAGAREQGSLVHRAMEAFVRLHPAALPANAEGVLRGLMEAELDALALPPRERFLWRAALGRMVAPLVEFEVEERARAETLALEAETQAQFDGPGGPFTIRGRIDRIDRERAGGGLVVIDYKTGRVPTKKQVEAGLAPQLPVSAVILERAGAAGVAPAPVSRLRYVARENKNAYEFSEPQDLIQAEASSIARMIDLFDDPQTAYLPRRMVERVGDAGDYDLLARVKEWERPLEEGGEE